MRARLIEYVEGFKSGDFDAVRAMLADDVKLDLVAKLRKQGKGEVGEYFGRYAACEQWAFAAGVLDGRAAMLVYDREVSLGTPAYFVALGFDGDRVASIHDFLFRALRDGWNRCSDHWSTTVIVAEMLVARHIEERGPGVLFRGGCQRLFEDASQAEEFVLPPADGMIVSESSAIRK